MKECVGIIFIGDIRFCPYLKQYVNHLEKLHIDYDIIFWQRDQVDRIYEQKNLIIYHKASVLQRKPYRKLIDFYGYRRFLIKQIKKQKYSKLILLTTLSGMLLTGTLSKYKGRYWFDYRDVSYEHLKPAKKLIWKMVENAYATSISSKGFKEVLPRKSDYIISHNTSIEQLKQKVIAEKKKDMGTPIILGYIGFVRNENLIKKMMDVFSTDQRFILKFFGTGPAYEKVIRYLEEKQYSNIFMYGYYKEEDKGKLIQSCDMINYYYPLTKGNKWALANRYYDGLSYKKPMWVCPDTYSGKLVMTQEIGIGVDIEDEAIGEKIYQYYKQLDYDAFKKRTEVIINEIIEEQKIYENKIDEFLN